MQIHRRALYNLLRMNWQQNKSLEVKPWQVEDYRKLETETLLAQLKGLGVPLNRSSFLAYAENSDNPEDLTDLLVGDETVEIETQDQIYLIVFELWRRLVNEKPSLSIFCDELDYQIDLYDHGLLEHPEALQDALANLIKILEENVDEGNSPEEVFEFVCANCANDIENFLYDYISDAIDEGNEFYASELIESFKDYINEPKWFDFLKVRLAALNNPSEARRLLSEILEDAILDADIEFNLEILAFMVQAGDHESFSRLVEQSIPLIKNEEDLEDLITISADYYVRLDQEEKQKALESILKERGNKDSEDLISQKDPRLKKLLEIVKSYKAI